MPVRECNSPMIFEMFMFQVPAGLNCKYVSYIGGVIVIHTLKNVVQVFQKCVKLVLNFPDEVG